MRKTFRNAALFSLMLALGQPLLTGCKDYDGDISNLQEQITAGNEGLEKLAATLSSQLGSVTTLANNAQTLAENAQASADAAAQKAKEASDEAQKALLLAQAANSLAESAKQEAVAEAAAMIAEEIGKVQDQINANGKTAQEALAATVANAENISSLEGKLSALQDYVNGLNILSASDVTSMINKALKEAGLDELPSQVSELYKTVQELAAEQANIKIQLSALASYEEKISELENTVGDLQDLVAKLQGQLNNMDGTLANLGVTVKDLEAALKTLINANSAAIKKVADDLAIEAGKITALQALVTSLQADLQQLQSGMMTSEAVNKLIADYLSKMDYITGSSLAATLKGYATSGDLQAIYNSLKDYVTSSELANTLKNYVTSTELAEILKNYSTTQELQSYISQEIAKAISETEAKNQAMIENYLKNYVTVSTYTNGISNLQGQIDTINSTLATIQSQISALQSKIAGINENLLTLQTDMLRGLIFFTDVYVEGLPALDYRVVNYGAFNFATANNSVTANLTYPGATTTSNVNVPINNTIYTAANTASPVVTENFFPTLQAMYTLNPSSAEVVADQLSIVTRGVTTRAEDTDILGKLNIESATSKNGVLTLDLNYEQPKLPAGTTPSNSLSGNYFAGTHNSMLFALVAEFDVTGENAEGETETVTNTVTSDWGLFNPVRVTLSNGGSIVYANPAMADVTPIDNPNYEITVNKGENLGNVNLTYNPLYYTDLYQVTDATSSVAGLSDALANAPTAMVPYNSTLDLNDQVLVAFTIEAPDKDYYFTLTPEELEQYDLTMNYKLINYTVDGQTYGAGHTAGESSYVTLNEGVLTPNPKSVEALGHMPMVMLYVTDADNHLVALSFLKVIISLPQTEAPAIKTIDLGVYPYNPGANEMSSVTVNYNTLATNSEAPMTITETQWINNYVSAPTISVSPNVANYGKIVKGANGNITWTLTSFDDYTDIWQAAEHSVTATVTFKSNISNLGDIVVPLQIEVARAQVPLGEKIPNVWSTDYSYALATLNVRNSGTITTEIDQFNVLLPSLFNGKQVLSYSLQSVASNPGPIYCDGNLYNAGLFPSLQLQNAKPLTIASNGWTLTTPGTNQTLSKVAYNFYLNQLNNTTVTIANGYLKGSYTLSVENKASSQLTSQYVLDNPFEVKSTGTEYNNTVVYATGNNNVKHTILTLDQNSGNVTIGAEAQGSTTPDAVALAILNEMESTGLKSLLSAQIGVSAWGNNGYAVSVLDNMFALNFLRPINVTTYIPAALKWNQRPLNFSISDCLTVQDIPGATFTAANYAWFNAYQIDLDIPNATYTVEGKTYNVSDYLSVTSGSSTSPIYVNAFTGKVYTPSGNLNEPVSVWATPTSGTPNYGTITFDTASPRAESNLVITRPTQVIIPAALTYSWGSIFFNITINVEPLQ